jgi:predicted transcriptional regulator
MAWLSNQNTRATPDDVPAFLKSMHDAVLALSAAPAEVAEEATAEHMPAVTSRKSLASPDFIISMIDGKPYKTLTRHLTTNGLTPAEYRQRYGLKPDYPMTAPSYSEARRAMAKKIGLGRKPGQKAPFKSSDDAAKSTGAKRGRPAKVVESAE